MLNPSDLIIFLSLLAGGEASNKSKAPSTPKAETPTAAKKAKLETSTPTPASPKPATPSGRSRSGRASSANLDPAPDSETEAVPGPGSQDKDGAGWPCFQLHKTSDFDLISFIIPIISHAFPSKHTFANS